MANAISTTLADKTAAFRNAGRRLENRRNAQTTSTANPTDGRYKKRSPMMLPIKIRRFEAGERVAKKKAMEKNTSLCLLQDTMAAPATAPQAIKAKTAFQSSQSLNFQTNSGIAL